MNVKKNKKKLVLIVALAVAMALGATFAYFNQELTAENPFDTGKYDSLMTEDFNPGDGKNWEPGAEVNKDVTVENTGNYDIIVRVKFDEKWTRKGETAAYKTVNGEAAYDSTTVYQESAKDGLVANDKSVVAKTLKMENWVKGADGWYYYKTNLASGKDTGVFLDAVTLDENADMGTYTVKKYYTKAATAPEKTAIGPDPETQWVLYTGTVPEGSLHNMTKTVQNEAGYSNSDYVLTITSQTVQASDDAIKAAFGNSFTAPSGTSWTLK